MRAREVLSCYTDAITIYQPVARENLTKMPVLAPVSCGISPNGAIRRFRPKCHVGRGLLRQLRSSGCPVPEN